MNFSSTELNHILRALWLNYFVKIENENKNLKSELFEQKIKNHALLGEYYKFYPFCNFCEKFPKVIVYCNCNECMMKEFYFTCIYHQERAIIDFSQGLSCKHEIEIEKFDL